MTSPDSDHLETLLASALRSRPEPVARFDLAEEAIFRAHRLQLNEARLTRLVRIKLWTRVATIAAAVLIATTLAIGYARFPVSTDTDTTTVTTTTTTTIDLTTLGVAALLITVIAVVLTTLLMPDRPQLRLAPA